MRRESGHAAVEIALVLPVVLTLTLGMFEWGSFLTQELEVVHIARDAAGAGSRTRPADDPAGKAVVRARAAVTAAGFPTTGVRVDATMGTVTAGPTIRVEVGVPYAPLTGLLPMPAELRAATTMRMQNR